MTEIDECRSALRELAIGRLAGRDVRTSHLVEAGLDAIVAGLDAPSLGLLAGLECAGEDAVDRALHQVVDELGIELPADATAARWLLVHGWLTAMVKGDLSPATGGALVSEVSELLGSPPSLRGITRWSAMLDNWIPTDLTPRDVCEVPILEESAALLEGPWPPRPRHP
ncbi:hypothetical protein [Amycolatopsis regifaucium]|uniref:Uncharacterized protein n=1 Tax=Amycolatopsis regifaucium TaxID=546365 RepID=A0A154MSJ0_9PSEU|nr:hypothetical protein [Amycolatopsis regifaucium]KZB86449.1 hypothetical protein AVL48_27055 [Amycolatopsis regifaucium]OKA06361.1 hypothetical protein ATP06_0224895 [Amycolatopsis regifaucium]SFJ30475.1 hypothetical protein SAMN04489731_118108 [Amycolatopsis regifaucium]